MHPVVSQSSSSEEGRHDTFTPPTSASGNRRCRVPCDVAPGGGASLSDTAGAPDRRACCRQQARRSGAPAVSDRLAPPPGATSQGTRQRRLPDAEVGGVKVSWRPSSLELDCDTTGCIHI